MRFLTLLLGTATLTLVGVAGVPPRLPEPPPGSLLRLSYPGGYREHMRHYAVVDRPDGTIRHLYVSPAALDPLARGLGVPVGTTVVLEQWQARRDAHGALVRDAGGHLVPDRLAGHLDVMQKTGERPGETRPWANARFDVAGAAPVDANLADCWSCHQSVAGRDFLFSGRALARFALSGEVQRRDCGRPDRQLCPHDFEDRPPEPR